MKAFRVCLALAMLFVLLFGTVQPGPTQTFASDPIGTTSATTGLSRLYLPLTTNGTSSQTLTSFDLIDQAVASSQISAEQGLIYKVFAQFSDARLPAQYVGAGVGRAGDLITEEVASQAATLSPSARQALTPFFVPPSDPRSWYYLPRLGPTTAAAGAQANPAGWVFKSAAGGKVRVFYYSTNASDADKATQIAGQFDAVIWSKLTTLMNKTPLPNVAGTTDIYLWDSYIKNDGTVVAFDANTLGITVGARCDQSAVTIYLPDSLPVGSAASPGLIQYATHEFMHAIQFAHTIQSCPTYRWLKEATATWAEDYVYPQADSEHETASSYLDRPAARLDDTRSMHDYGAYLLFYFLTHKVDPSAAVIRRVWQNAGGTGNSYLAMDNAVNQASPAWHDVYWPLYLATLWNKAPYETYYATSDGLTVSVALAGGSPISITTPSGEQATPLQLQLPTGGAIFYDLTFPDSSVRSLTIMNGLGYKLSIGDATGEATDTIDGDKTYVLDDLSSAADGQGVTVELLLKASGLAAQPYPTVLSDSQASLQEFGYCMDAQGPMDEIVVILSNADWANPNRIMKPEDLPVTVFANNVPCWKLQGTFKALDYDDGTTYESDGTVTYGWPSSMQALAQPYMNLTNMFFPETRFVMLNAQAHWSYTGTYSGSGCTYSGSGNWSAGEEANDYINSEQGVTAGSPTYRGYRGEAGAAVDTAVRWRVTCPDMAPYDDTGYPMALAIPLSDFRSQIKVDASGNLTGNFTIPNYEGRYQQYQWNLTGVKK